MGPVKVPLEGSLVQGLVWDPDPGALGSTRCWSHHIWVLGLARGRLGRRCPPRGVPHGVGLKAKAATATGAGGPPRRGHSLWICNLSPTTEPVAATGQRASCPGPLSGPWHAFCSLTPIRFPGCGSFLQARPCGPPAPFDLLSPPLGWPGHVPQQLLCPGHPALRGRLGDWLSGGGVSVLSAGGPRSRSWAPTLRRDEPAHFLGHKGLLRGLLPARHLQALSTQLRLPAESCRYKRPVTAPQVLS